MANLRRRLGRAVFAIALVPIAALVFGVAWYARSGDEAPVAQKTSAKNPAAAKRSKTKVRKKGQPKATLQTKGGAAKKASKPSASAQAPGPDRAPKPGPSQGQEQKPTSASPGSKRPANAPGDSRSKASDKPENSDPFAEFEAAIKRGNHDAAIRSITRLLRTTHKNNPYLNLQLGHEYFVKGRWTDGLQAYTSSLKKRRDYARKDRVVNNAIRALSSDRTRAAATRLIVNYIGRSGLPALRRAAKGDKNRKVRQRAGALVRRIAR